MTGPESIDAVLDMLSAYVTAAIILVAFSVPISMAIKWIKCLATGAAWDSDKHGTL